MSPSRRTFPIFFGGLVLVIGALVLGALVLNSGSTPSASSSVIKPTRTPIIRLAVDGPACLWNIQKPIFDENITCAEMVYDHVTPPEAAPALMGLAFGPDGTLYMARTASGEVWAMRDNDGDLFPDEPYRVAAGLYLPTNLTVHAGALYVASVGGLIRLDSSGGGQFDQQTVLVDDWATSTGYWPGSVQVGPDERLVVSLGANCITCQEVDTQSGRLVSYALDGSDEQVIAVGFRRAADFAWHPQTGDLWIVDSGRVIPGSMAADPPDELNRVIPGADYGFPGCYGDRVPDSTTVTVDCSDTEPPAYIFGSQSDPAGIVFYPFDAPADWGFWRGDLLVALRGSWNRPEPAGYAVAIVPFGDGFLPGGALQSLAPTSSFSAYRHNSLSVFSLTGLGFFPYHPADVAVSAEGWVYVSVEEGQIFRFRPRPAE